jgi:hypothetical protein
MRENRWGWQHESLPGMTEDAFRDMRVWASHHQMIAQCARVWHFQQSLWSLAVAMLSPEQLWLSAYVPPRLGRWSPLTQTLLGYGSH